MLQQKLVQADMHTRMHAAISIDHCLPHMFPLQTHGIHNVLDDSALPARDSTQPACALGAGQHVLQARQLYDEVASSISAATADAKNMMRTEPRELSYAVECYAAMLKQEASSRLKVCTHCMAHTSAYG